MLLIFQQACLAANRLIVVIKTYRLSSVEYSESKTEKFLFNVGIFKLKEFKDSLTFWFN